MQAAKIAASLIIARKINMNIRALLSERFRNAMSDAGIPGDFQPHITPAKKAGFGDYQANGAMAAAKAMKKPPRDVAQLILDNLQLEGIANKTEIAGPGFINIHLDPRWLARQIEYASDQPRLGMDEGDEAQQIVIDYSSPNLAKEMHVGHVRTTVLGDALARILEFMGHKVIRQNHVGDWGTQFGMLIAELESHLKQGEEAAFALSDLESFYRQAKTHFDADPNFANTAREYVVKLQSGDAAVLTLWEQFKNVSLQHAAEIYEKMNISLKPEDVRGESAYNDLLADVVLDLQEKGIVVEDKGAQVAFLKELADKNGDPAVVIIQKSDGGYLYSTTDLAALKYRSETLKADRVMYFIDARQSLHMQQVFCIGRKAGYADEWLSLEHHAFGMILGDDNKPFKTRSGDTVKLADLLDEAVERADKIVRTKLAERGLEFAEQEIQDIAHKVGIGAVKYADLSKTRTNDYVFNWDSMLRFEGNTGPYMQYAYTRIYSIFRKADEDLENFAAPIHFAQDQEYALGVKLMQFSEALEQVALEAYPHVLCNYLYDLSSAFSTFYDACPILRSDVDPQTRSSRLMLSKGVATTLKTGLNLLGIQVMPRM